MAELGLVLLLAAVPPIGVIAGAALAEVIAVSPRRLSLALHAAAGILLGIAAFELLPTAFTASSRWPIVAAFVLGAAVYVVADRLIERMTGRGGGGEAWMIYSGVAVDLFSDGVMLGTSTTIGIGLAVVLAAAQLPANVPEGYATSGAFQDAGMGRGRRLLVAVSFALPVLLGAVLSYLALRGAPEIWRLALLAATAGYLAAAVVEELVPEAHERLRGWAANWAFVAGLAGLGLLSLIEP